ncbi:MAG TPA: hypothetical protein ENK57_02925 [Polyangiaceae bacterium]|nr:hypothetical protein [Polyangiaceae bacterium]
MFDVLPKSNTWSSRGLFAQLAHVVRRAVFPAMLAACDPASTAVEPPSAVATSVAVELPSAVGVPSAVAVYDARTGAREHGTAGELEAGTVLRTDAGGEAVVVELNRRQGHFTVFNLEVAEAHCYFVRGDGSDGPGVLVHNKPMKSLLTASKAAGETTALVPVPKARGNPNTAPARGTTFVDPKGNAITTPPGGKITGSPDGKFIQARDAAGNPTGVRIDGGHKPAGHPDPRAQAPHGHVPEVTNPDGTPWLPIKE